MAKMVRTYDDKGNVNGYLIELEKDGKKTVSYLTALYPGCKKGYHLHLRRESNYICVQGQVDVVYWTKEPGFTSTPVIKNHKFILNQGDELHVPTFAPVALFNHGKETAVLVNRPNPAYNPADKGEQLEFNAIDCAHGHFPGWEGDEERG
jgi:uncharacterized RmlC-like cupin family protein